MPIFQLFSFTYIIGRGPQSPSLGAVKMIAFTYVSVFVCCLAYAAAVEEVPEGLSPPPPPPRPEDVARRELTDSGYVIRYGDASYGYPLRIVPVVRQIQTKNPIETNEIDTDGEDGRRPLFYFTTYENPSRKDLPNSRPYIEIRKKREATPETPDSQKVNLRKKRTYCGKCGRGGYGGGGYYVPVTYAVYPVYGGGGGGGCNTCGGGHGGGGGGGSFSYSSSSAQSSAGSFGWGRK